MYLHCNEKLTLKKIAQQFYYSESTVSAHITQMTGLSFFDLLNEMRICKTVNYLLYTDLTLRELAEILGFVDESHISKVFATRVGDRIGQYRATYQKVQNICHIEEERIGYTIVNYIYRNYASPLTAKSVAAKFQITVPKLQQLLVEQVEFNFEDFLNQIRVNHACELLITTELTVLDVALDVGYNSQKTLTRNFVKLKVMTPSAFRGKFRSKSGRVL
jgi:AraC-like DNA-binding protein